MANILAVFDTDKKYVRKLSAYLEKRNDLPFEVQGFDDMAKLMKYGRDHEIAVLLADEEIWKGYSTGQDTDLYNPVFDQSFPNPFVKQTILLTKNKASEHLNADSDSGMEPLIYKFQSGELIAKKLLGICANLPDDVIFNAGIVSGHKSNCKIVGVYSPVKRCMQTPFALIYSRLQANEKKTLYLNFEVFSGFSAWFQKEYQTDLMDLMYFLKSDPDRFLLKLAGMTEEFGNVRYIPPAYSYEDFMSVSGDQWVHLIQTIAQKSDFEVIVMDLGDQMQGLFSILTCCDRIYTITKPDGLAQAKISAYEEMLQLTEHEQILEKTVKCRLPVFKEISQDVNALPYGQLADYMRNKLGED